MLAIIGFITVAIATLITSYAASRLLAAAAIKGEHDAAMMLQIMKEYRND